MISIFGYGSLMNVVSAKRTMPNATNFRPGELCGYTRCYNLVSISGIKSGLVNLDTKEMAALSIRKVDNSTVIDDETNDISPRVSGIIFDIPEDESIPYFEREHRYKPVQINVTESESHRVINVWSIIEQTDAEYKTSILNSVSQQLITPPESENSSGQCLNNEELVIFAQTEYNNRVGQYYQGQLWGRNDIYPMPKYCISCLLAAFDLGGVDYVVNMLEHTLLADGHTSLHVYLKDKVSYIDPCTLGSMTDLPNCYDPRLYESLTQDKLMTREEGLDIQHSEPDHTVHGIADKNGITLYSIIHRVIV